MSLFYLPRAPVLFFYFPVREKVLAGLGSRCPSTFKGPSSFALGRDLILRGEKDRAGLATKMPFKFCT